MTDTRVVGTSVPRTDAVAKVTGTADYTGDLSVPGMLYACVVRSARAHATIVSLDTAVAMGSPGVAAVVTAGDLAPLFSRFGHIVADHPILAGDRVRYYGEPVAIVVATTPHAAKDGAALVRISYDDLPALMTIDMALADGAILIHDEEYERSLGGSFNEAQSENRGTNLAHTSSLVWGDVDEALAAADLVVESQATYPMLYAYAMEPYAALAHHDGSSLAVSSSAQHPYMVRSELARTFSLPLSSVRVSVPFIGGGYGSKSYTKVEPLAAVASWWTRRPVRLVLDVEEAVYTTRVDAAVVRVASGFDSDGRLLARDIQLDLDTGAYADNSPLLLAKAVNRCFGPYRVPNLRVVGRCVYTNTIPASSYRGFGAPQGNLASELNLDIAAQRLDLDPVLLRKRNLVRPGEVIIPGKRPLDADLAADLDILVESLHDHGSADAHDRAYGIGFACSASDAGAMPISTVIVRVLTDGSVIVSSGSTEMGQGSRTVLSQIAAQELGVGTERVRVVQSDTDATPFEWSTGASRTTTIVGLAVVRACADVRRKAREMAAEVWACDAAEVRETDAGVERAGVGLGFGALIEAWYGAIGGEIIGVGIVRRAGEHALLPSFWEIGMVGVGVEVDLLTGEVTVDQLVTVADVGFALHPRQLEGQDLGAAMQGLGAALHEELVYDGPQPVNPNVVDYRIPRVSDVPRRIDNMIIERRDGIGPYGAKGGGEGTLNPIGAAVAAAVGRAVGAWPDRLPLTPERVLQLIEDGRRE